MIAGVSGITGGSLAEYLLSAGWEVHGLARQRHRGLDGVAPAVADLRHSDDTRAALRGVPATHAFYCTWSRQATEAENCRVNRAMLESFLDALGEAPLEHVALVTGAKHYYQRAAGLVCESPFREDEPRLPGENFYYQLEDALFERAARRGFSYSVHRPGTVVGYALGNQMNLGVCLALYGSLCRETGSPFRFPGTEFAWNALSQVTDAGLLARQMAWAAVTGAARGQAFNVANGDLFRWRWLWPRLAAEFGVAPTPPVSEPQTLAAGMAGAAAAWRAMAQKYGLALPEIADQAPWWHVDSDLSRPFESVADLTKSRRLGFQDFAETPASFARLFERLRRERVIPDYRPSMAAEGAR